MTYISIILIFSVISFILGLFLKFLAEKFKVEESPIIEQIDKLLPQTQCGQCGYAGCKQYAEAIAKGDAKINLCIPGGTIVIQDISKILNIQIEENDQVKVKQIAYIDESNCIGCHKCASSCPVDAIVGGPKYMHTVIKKRCFGCNKCVSTCPIKCISMIDRNKTPEEWDFNMSNTLWDKNK